MTQLPTYGRRTLQRLSAVVFDRDGMYMNIRDIYGTYKAHIRDIYETHMGHTQDTWDIYGTYIRHIRDIYGTYMRHIWDTPARVSLRSPSLIEAMCDADTRYLVPAATVWSKPIIIRAADASDLYQCIYMRLFMCIYVCSMAYMPHTCAYTRIWLALLMPQTCVNADLCE